MASHHKNSTQDRNAARQHLQLRLAEGRDRLIALCSELGRNDSQNPPGDTRGMVATCLNMLDGIPRITVETIVSEEPKVNLVARLTGGGPGRRLVMNGHLDTGPVVEPAQWTVPPFGGVITT